MAAKEDRVHQLDARMGDPAFWNDAEAARTVIAEANSLKAWTEPWNRLSAKTDELVELDFEPDGVRCVLTVPVRRPTEFSIRAGRPGGREPPADTEAKT